MEYSQEENFPPFFLSHQFQTFAWKKKHYRLTKATLKGTILFFSFLKLEKVAKKKRGLLLFTSVSYQQEKQKNKNKDNITQFFFLFFLVRNFCLLKYSYIKSSKI